MTIDRKVRWGILSTAAIGMKHVNPAIMESEHSEIVALASRDIGKARTALAELGLPNAKAYGSYAELYADPEIDAIYNPLPNHLHVSETLAAARAGKHVLCEKPIALSTDEAKLLVDAPRGILIAEAFMVRHHPQWQRVREIIQSGELGRVSLVRASFLYYNDDPHNVRNMADIGGGATYDIGCYCVTAGRYFFGAEPKRVVSLVDRDPNFGTDRLTSLIADFGDGRQLSAVCGTQSADHQTIQVIGEKANLEIILPFNAPADEPTRLVIGHKQLTHRTPYREEIIPPANQYTRQAENFALAVLGKNALEHDVQDAIMQVKVLDAIFRSETTGGWSDV